jgi:hypothetical protein
MIAMLWTCGTITRCDRQYEWDGELSVTAQDFPPHRASASLKEFVLNLSMSVDQYRLLLPAIRSPIMEKLGVILTEEEFWDSQKFNEFLLELS